MKATTIESGSELRGKAGVFPRSVWVWLLLAGCFLTYPLALVVPARCGVDFRTDISLPVMLWGAVFAMIGLARLGHPARTGGGGAGLSPASVVRRLIRWGLPLAVFCLLLAWRVADASFADIATFAGLFAIPLYLALAPRARVAAKWGLAFGLLWLVHAVHGLHQVAIGREMVGMAWNRNWAAAMVLALAPWAWQAVADRRRGTHWAALWGLVVGGVTLFLCWHARSRATFLFGGAYLFLYVAMSWRARWGRILILLLAVAGLAGVLVVGGDRLREGIARDIRGPMWLGTLEMALDQPLAGHGPGNFRRKFVDFRSPLQTRSPKFAPVTLHPHNQVLYIAAVGGIPLALAWSALAVHLLIRRRKGFFWCAVHFSGFILVGCSLLDLTLFRAPTALLGLIMLGLHLRGLWRVRLSDDAACRLTSAAADSASPPSPRCLPCPMTRWGFAFLLAGLAVWRTGEELASGHYLRKAHLAEARQDWRQAYVRHLQAHAAYPADPEGLYRAAETALLQLRDPRSALAHAREIFRSEPKLAHVNGLMAMAYEQTGDAPAALAAFDREAELFPYDVAIQSQALERFLRAGKLTESLDTRSRLAAARWTALVNRIGDAKAREMAADFRLAVLEGRHEQAVATANRILENMPPQPVAEPLYHQLLRQGRVRKETGEASFSGAECAYWAQALAADKSPAPRLADGLPGFEHAIRATLSRLPARGGDRTPLDVAEHFRLSGWMAAGIFADSAEFPPLVEVRWSEWSALIVMPDRIITDAAAGNLADPEKLAEFALAMPPPAGIVARVPVRTADLLTRNQILGDIIRLGKANGCPVLGESPTLYLEVFKFISGGAATEKEPTVLWQASFR